MMHTLRSRMALALLTLVAPRPAATTQEPKEPIYDGKPLSHWIREFESQKGDDRSSAARAIGEIGPDAASAVPVLVKALKDDAYWIADALGRIGAPAIPALKEALRDANPTVRSRAAGTLEEMGPEARTTIPALVERLKDRDAGVRRAAACALNALAPDAEAAIPSLIAALRDEDDAVPCWAARALGRIGSKAKEAVPDLVEMLGKPDETSREDAVRALGGIGPEAKAAIPALLRRAIRDESWKVRYKAYAALVRIGEPAVPALREAMWDKERMRLDWVFFALHQLGAPAVPVLVEGLRGPEDVRGGALSTLGELGTEAKAAVPALLDYLKKEEGPSLLDAAAALWRIAKHPAAADVLRKGLAEKDWELRFFAALTAAEVGVETETAASILADGLKRQDLLRGMARHSLSRLGKNAAPAVPTLTEMLKSENADDRSDAVLTLGAVGSEPAVKALIEAVKDKEGGVRDMAARSLGRIGPGAKAAVPQLVALLKEKDDPAHVSAAEALWKIEKHKESLPALAAALKREDPFQARQAAEALGAMGAAAKDAVPVLIEAVRVRDQIDIVRPAAARALGVIGPPAKEAVSALNPLLTAVSSDTRLSAAEALWRIEQDPKVLRVLFRMVQERDLGREKATELLGRIGPKAKEAVPTLIYALRDLDDYSLRPRAAEALGRIGAEARAALPYLKESLHDNYPEVRRAAAEAIRKIDPDATKAPGQK